MKELKPYPDRGANGSPRFKSLGESLSWHMTTRRVMMGQSSEIIARRCNIARATYSTYESGNRLPRLDDFVRICNALYLSYEQIIDDADWEL